MYILKSGKISVNISVLGTLYSYHCIGWGEIWREGVDHSSMSNFTPTGAMCRPCGEKNLKIAL